VTVATLVLVGTAWYFGPSWWRGRGLQENPGPPDLTTPPTTEPSFAVDDPTAGEEQLAYWGPPDLMKLPGLGPSFDIEDLIEGEFDQTGFLDRVDAEIGFAYGLLTGESVWFEGYDEEWDRGVADGADRAAAEREYDSCLEGDDAAACVRPDDADYFAYASDEPGHWAYWEGVSGSARSQAGASDGPIAVIAGFSLDSGESLWQIDLEEALGLDRRNGPAARLDLVAMGEGVFGIEVTHYLRDGYAHVLGTFDGEVLSSTAKYGVGFPESAGATSCGTPTTKS
jgi:hypothetical protein